RFFASRQLTLRRLIQRQLYLVGLFLPDNLAGLIDVVALLGLGFQAGNDLCEAVTKLTTVVVAGSDYHLASLVNVTRFVVDLYRRKSVFKTVIVQANSARPLLKLWGNHEFATFIDETCFINELLTPHDNLRQAV